MGFAYPDKFTYLNTLVMEVARRCSDIQGPTVVPYSEILMQLFLLANFKLCGT